MKKLLFLLLTGALFFTTSCNNDDDEPAFTFDCTYMKVKEGSKLTSKIESFDIFGGSTESTTTSEVVDQSEIDNTLVAVFENEMGLQSFVTCEGEKFIVTAQGQTMVDGAVTMTEDILLTLDLGRTVGEDYEVATIVSNTTFYGETFQTINKYIGRVVEKDMTMVVEGTTYTDVVKFEMESYTTSSLVPDLELFTSTTTYYMAPEVATILTEIYDESQGFLTLKSSLTSYEY